MTALIVVFLLAYASLIGLGLYFGCRYWAYRKQKRRHPLYFRAEEEPVGEARFCDGYSAGTFYW